METKKSTKNLAAKLAYAAPILRSLEVELEEGIAGGSPGGVESNPQQQFERTETQSQEVQNNWW